MKQLLIVLTTIFLMQLTQYAHSKINNDVKLDMSVTGNGDAVVIFEAGFGMSKETWDTIANDVSQFATSVTYSRAGIGDSQPHALPATISKQVNDLLTIITHVAEGKSVFLVGHSFGGLLITEFSRQYPELVEGLVLIDPAVLAQRKQYKMLDAERVAQDDQWLRTVMPPQLHGQYEILIKQMDAASAVVKPLSAQVPTVLFTATSAPAEPMVLEETITGKAIWLSLHNALMKDVVDGTHFRVANTGHFIYRERPELVVQAISDLISHRQ